MQKIVLILLLIFIHYSCSVIRKADQTGYDLLKTDETKTNVLSLTDKNITERNFFIQKAEIDFISISGMEKVIGSIKYERPDKFLISIKSKTGIEAVRIFISRDTILINDRINKRILYGDPDYLKNKYGIPDNLMGLIVGDYISDNNLELNKKNCLNGKYSLNDEADGIKMKYIIDCKLNKVIYASNETALNANRIEIKFGHFKAVEAKLVPEEIEINDFKTNTHIVIRIKKIEYPWTGNVEFIPGYRYEVRKLL